MNRRAFLTSATAVAVASSTLSVALPATTPAVKSVDCPRWIDCIVLRAARDPNVTRGEVVVSRDITRILYLSVNGVDVPRAVSCATRGSFWWHPYTLDGQTTRVIFEVPDELVSHRDLNIEAYAVLR